MWEGLSPDILSGPAETAPHFPLLDFMKLTATGQAPAAGQAMDQLAKTQLPFSATFVDDTIRYHILQIRASCLPGLVPFAGATEQLASIQQTQLAFFQVQAVAKAKTKTLLEYNANIVSAIRAIAQVSGDRQLSSYWCTRAELKASN
jgi:hypothetical protein